MTESELNAQKLMEKILSSKKYRGIGLNPNTIQDLIHQEALHHTSEKKLLKTVRRKLHNIVAPYLGEPDYPKLLERLSTIPDTSLDSPELRTLCLEILSQHASTAERMPHMSAFYNQLFAATGKPRTLIDLACGLHPLAIPWMGFPVSTQYHAYDIIQPRIDFINTFLLKLGMNPGAENRDILVNPPEVRADMAIFFKEAHRFEKRLSGSNRAFWSSLNVDNLAVSLPTQNLTGTHNLIEQHRSLVYGNLPKNKPVVELIIENEILFIIKNPGDHIK